MSSTSNPRPIVVGIDGRPGSGAVLRFAFEEGLVRGADVRVVTTWMPGLPQRDVVTYVAYGEESAEARRMQDAVIADLLDEMPDHPAFTQVVVNDLGGPALTAAARGASMLVIGAGRKGVLSRAFMGSVSEFCVRHSPVPVVVVPTPAQSGDRPDRADLAQSKA